MAYTDAERAVGRRWRDERRALLEALPEPDMPLPAFLAHVRHECTALGGRSVSFPFQEVYLPSPEYVACGCGAVSTQGFLEGAHSCTRPPCTTAVTIPAGRFAFVYREGQCPDCKLTARSSGGPGVGWRLVDGYTRPPIGRARVRPAGEPADPPGQGGRPAPQGE